MGVWKIIFLSKWVICRFHVNLPGRMLVEKALFLLVESRKKRFSCGLISGVVDFKMFFPKIRR